MSKLNEYAIVYVDDEAMSLKYFEKEFSKDFNVFTATSGADGWDLIQKHAGQVGVLMSDQRMPGQTGVQLLEKVRHHFPQIIRILVTAYSDIDSAVAGINDSAIFRYISKPWEVGDLRITLLRALEFYGVLKERDHLLREKLSVLQQIVLCDRTKNLGAVAAGLAAHFRNTLSAASSFAAAVPIPPRGTAVEESLRPETGKNTEIQLRRASQEVFYIADGMRKLAEETSGFSLEPLPLERLLGPVTQINSVNSTAPVSLRLGTGLPKIKAVQSQIAKLFTLLVGNLHAVSENGTPISIETAAATADTGRELVKIHLADSGPDWSSKQRLRFFAPFATVGQEAGTLGLDLAICYFIVHHHGGRITVPGQPKSRVVIELPVDPLACGDDGLKCAQLDDLFRQELGFA